MGTRAGLGAVAAFSILLVAGCSEEPATSSSELAQQGLPSLGGDRLGFTSGSCRDVALATNVRKIAEGGIIQVSAKSSCNDDAPPEYRFEAFEKGRWVEVAPWSIAAKTSFIATGVGSVVVRVFVRPQGQAASSATASAFVNVIHSAWLAIDEGLGAGDVVALGHDPFDRRIRYAGTNDGLFVSYDEGRRWSFAGGDPISLMYVHPGTGTVFAVFEDAPGDAYFSCDRGSSWTKILIDHEITSVTVDPVNPERMFAGNCLGVYASNDYGTSFAPLFQLPATVAPSSQSCFSALSVDPTAPQTIYAVRGDSELWRSSDGGQTFVARSTLPASAAGPGTGPRFLSLPWNASTLLFGTGGSGVYRSSDGGTSFSETNRPTDRVYALAADPSSRTVYAAVSTAVDPKPVILASSDDGASWSQTSMLSTDSAAVASLATDPLAPSTLWAGTSGGRGLFVSRDGGLSFSASSAGIDNGNVRSIAVDPKAPNTVYTIINDVFATSSNGGRSWKRPAPSLAVTGPLALDPTQTQNLYSAVGLPPEQRLVKSTDGGATWVPLPLIARARIDQLIVDPQRSALIYANDFADALYRSENAGSTWRAIFGRNHGVAIAPSNPDTMYALAWGGGTAPLTISKSRDGGRTWSAITTAPVGQPPRVDVAIDPHNANIVYVLTGNELHRTKNGGLTWEELPIRAPHTLICHRFSAEPCSGGWNKLLVDPANPTTLYAAAGLTLIKSPDQGKTWREVGNVGTALSAFALDPTDPAIAYLGTAARGLFKTTSGAE
jgi:photosystem II stability/assembly factor-like uncharacterized protein